MSQFACRLLPLAVAASLAALASASCSEGRSTPSASRPDVLLLTVDTLRADFVSSYGFALETTPAIDELARRGVLFELAIAASTATVPSHASIMTSRYVREHSVGSWNGATRLAGTGTLADRFRDAGYDTAAFVSNVVLKARTGLDRGFDVYDDDLPEAESNRGMVFERTADATAARALAWLAAPRSRPFFLWVHLQDPHGPYTPPSPWDLLAGDVPLRTDRELPVLRVNRGRGGIPDYQALDGLRRPARYAGLYAGEVAFTDHHVGKLVAAAAAASTGRGTVVLLTADHGESLDEAGFFFQHGHATTPEQARVPFLLVAPGVAPARVPDVVSHVDVAPTLLELAGLSPLEEASGVSLVPRLRRGEPLGERVVFSDIGREISAYDEGGYVTVRIARPESGTSPASAERAIREQKLEWQRYERVPATEASSAAGWRKAGETAALPPEVLRYLSSEAPVVTAHAMGEGDVERLRALGYLPPAAAPDTEKKGTGN